MAGDLTPREYQILVEQAPIMIWRSDTSGACDYFNERWLAFTGREMSQELGAGWAEGVHPDDLERCLTIYRTAFDAQEPFEMLYRLQRHDGEYRWIQDNGAPFYNDERFQGYIGSCIDVTEQVRARELVDEARRKELARLERLLPICAHCKNIRNDEGYWEAVELYLLDHSDTRLSHSICPDCMRELYPDYAQDE